MSRSLQLNDQAIIAVNNVEYPVIITSISPDRIVAGDYTLIFTANGWQVENYTLPHTVSFRAVNREQLLSGVSDVDRLILLDLDYRSLLAACTSDPFTNKICQDDFFWRQKVERDMGTEVMQNKPVGMSYREQYRTLTEGMSKADAIKNGRLDYLIMTVTNFPQTYEGENDSYFYWTDSLEAAEYGKINVLEWAQNHGITINSSTAELAARGGQINLLQWLYDRNISFDDKVFTSAIRGQHKNVIEWLLDRGIKPVNSADIAGVAVDTGDIDMLNFLETKGMLPDRNDFDGAVEEDLVDVVKWLIDRNIIPLNPGNIANSAMGNCNFVMLELLATHGILPDMEAYNFAYRSNSWKMIKWLRDHGIEPD